METSELICEECAGTVDCVCSEESGEDNMSNEMSDETIDNLCQQARKEFNLPEYYRDHYKRFVAELYDANVGDLQHYRGRFYYEGPGVVR